MAPIFAEPATISIQSTRPALLDNESTTLNCSADGGYPPTSSISFVKNGRVISTSSDEELVINIAANDTSPFGQYMCLVNNSVTTMTTSVLLKQKGDNCLYVDHTLEFTNSLYWYLPLSGEIQVVLVLRGSRQCDRLNVSAQCSWL